MPSYYMDYNIFITNDNIEYLITWWNIYYSILRRKKNTEPQTGDKIKLKNTYRHNKISGMIYIKGLSLGGGIKSNLYFVSEGLCFANIPQQT